MYSSTIFPYYKRFFSGGKIMFCIKWTSRKLFVHEFGLTERNAFKLSLLSGTSIWYDLNLSSTSGQVRSLTCDVISHPLHLEAKAALDRRDLGISHSRLCEVTDWLTDQVTRLLEMAVSEIRGSLSAHWRSLSLPVPNALFRRRLSAEGAKPESNNRWKSDLSHVCMYVCGWVPGGP